MKSHHLQVEPYHQDKTAAELISSYLDFHLLLSVQLGYPRPIQLHPGIQAQRAGQGHSHLRAQAPN